MTPPEAGPPEGGPPDAGLPGPGGVRADPPASAVHRRGATFWLSALAGWALIGWGLRGAFHHHIDTRPAELFRFFLGGAVIHDLVVAPLVLVVGIGVARLVPAAARAFVQAGLIVTGSLALFAYPEVRDYARILRNPTSLPRNYTANLMGVVAVVWVTVVAVAVVRARRSRPARRTRPRTDPGA